MIDLHEIESAFHRRGVTRIAGVDEAGRGPLAGPVVAGAVGFAPGPTIGGVHDSKKLTMGMREQLYDKIVKVALSVGIGLVDHEEIDRQNILNATFAAMHIALGKLVVRPEHVLVDGNLFRTNAYEYTAVVHGDALCFSIAAASIVAKVTRDRLMMECALKYPGYGFERHKGYGTPGHFEALRRFGPCPIHRRSFLGRIPAPAPADICVPAPKGEQHVSTNAGPVP